MGASVVMTDREEKLLQLVNKNIEANKETIVRGGGETATELMDWNNRAKTAQVALTKGPFDYIIASDILYSSPSHAMLVETLWQCASIDTKVKLFLQLACTLHFESQVFIAYPSRDLEWEVRSKGVDPVPPDERCLHKFTGLAAERFDSSIAQYYPPTEPRRGNKGYSVYVMGMQLK
uniref:Calmodulin-lysine N-methyltransferase n=2 Tax=Lotharella globosa TaxID=91324 RepID=A0A7S3ZID0_9EUKA